MVTLYKPDGTVKAIEISQSDELASMQEAVGGHVQLVSCPDEGTHVFVDEDGLHKNLPYNSFGKEKFGLDGNILVCNYSGDDDSYS